MVAEARSIIGVDGTSDGWIAARLPEQRLEHVRTLADLNPGPGDLIAVDIPLAFAPEDGRRACEESARDLLSRAGAGRASSIFFTHPASVYQAAGAAGTYGQQYQRALATSRTTGLGGISRQSFALRNKIMEAKGFAAEASSRQVCVIEVHPETEFVLMQADNVGSAEPLRSKRTWTGQRQRWNLLAEQSQEFDPDQFVGDTDNAAPDDVLDAIAALRVGRWHAEHRATPLGSSETGGLIWTTASA